jgi:hypothetical protein
MPFSPHLKKETEPASNPCVYYIGFGAFKAVAMKKTDVSEERIASIFRVE